MIEFTRKLKALKSPTHVVWHCSATRPHQNIGAAEIHQWHLDRGWSGIGYHAVLRRAGTLEIGRPWNKQGAHAKNWNHRALGICMIGGLDSKGNAVEGGEFTREQWRLADAVNAMLRQMWPDVPHIGHRDLSPDQDGDGVIEPWEWMKSCPCFDVQARWPA